jgi:hypothetical protein
MRTGHTHQREDEHQERGSWAIVISNKVFEGWRTLMGRIGTVLMASAQPAGAGFQAGLDRLDWQQRRQIIRTLVSPAGRSAHSPHAME